MSQPTDRFHRRRLLKASAEPAAVAEAMRRVFAANLEGDVPVRAKALLEAAESKKK
jgi:hypothetical protein